MKAKSVLLILALGIYALTQGFVLVQRGKPADAALSNLNTPMTALKAETTPQAFQQTQ